MSNYVYLRSHGLGAVTRNGFTVEYYAAPATLDFKDRKMKKLYEDLRNADIDYQKMMNDVANNLRPVMGTLEFLSGGKIKAAELEKLFSVKLPTSGMAVFLEVACGGRPLDQGFQAVAQMLKRDFTGSAALFGTLGGVSAAVSAAALIPSPATPFLVSAAAVLVPVATIAIPASLLCGAAAALLGSIITGQLPSKKDFGDTLKAAARLSGSPEPSQEEIDRAYAGLKDANDVAFVAAGGKPAPGQKTVRTALDQAKEKKARLLEEEQARQRAVAAAAAIVASRRIEPVRPQTKDEPPPSSFPIVPAALAAGVALFLFMRR